MSALDHLLERTASSPSDRYAARTSRGLAAIEDRAILAAGEIQGRSLVAATALREGGYLAAQAAFETAFLQARVEVLTRDNPMLADRCEAFQTLAAVGMANVLADTFEGFCREVRR